MGKGKVRDKVSRIFKRHALKSPVLAKVDWRPASFPVSHITSR